jgi:hypothetical protein
MARRGKGLSFTAEEIEDLCSMRYGDRRLFCLLTLLYDFVDTRNNFHIDHFYPRSRFTSARLRGVNVPEAEMEELQERVDEVPNLQLLEGGPNTEKSAKWPADWLDERFGPTDGATDGAARHDYLQRHDLTDIGPGIVDFGRMFATRRELIRTKLQKLLS